MGYALTDGDKVLCKGSGPADGDPPTITSRRSKLFGLAAMLEVLLAVKEHTLALQNAVSNLVRVRIWVDSDSAIKQYRRIQGNCQLKPAFPDDADILAHVRWLLTQIQQYEISVEWVKSHQDEGTNWKDLPLNSCINVMVDDLAMDNRESGKSYAKKPRAQALMFQAARVNLIENGRRVTAKYEDAMRYHINETRLRKFAQSTRLWEDATWTSIDIDGVGEARKTMESSDHRRRSKTMYGWHNTGHQRRKMFPLASAECPRCGHEDETYEHILQCSAASAQAERYRANVKLASTVVTKGGGLRSWAVLHKGIETWLYGKEVKGEIVGEASQTPLEVCMAQAMEEQPGSDGSTQ